jgi:hypothetical protein
LTIIQEAEDSTPFVLIGRRRRRRTDPRQGEEVRDIRHFGGMEGIDPFIERTTLKLHPTYAN